MLFPVRLQILRLAQSVWGMLAMAGCLMLVVAQTEGRTSTVTLAPVILIVWALGHGALRLMKRSLAREEAQAALEDKPAPSWPVALILAAAGAGLTTFLGGFALLLVLTSADPGPNLEVVWASLGAVWLAHATCFAALFLRRKWSALYTAVLCFSWALLLGAEIADTLSRGFPIQLGELIIMSVLITLAVLFGRHLMTSRRIKQFLSIPIAN